MQNVDTTANIKFKIDDRTFNEKFLVIESMNFVILGMNFIRRNNAKLDFNKKTIKIGERKNNIYLKYLDENKNFYYHNCEKERKKECRTYTNKKLKNKVETKPEVIENETAETESESKREKELIDKVTKLENVDEVFEPIDQRLNSEENVQPTEIRQVTERYEAGN